MRERYVIDSILGSLGNGFRSVDRSARKEVDDVGGKKERKYIKK